MMVGLTIIVLAIDIISKLIVGKMLKVHESIEVIPNFFNITYVKNTGAAFSILDDNAILVLLISVVIIASIVIYIHNNKPTFLIEKISYAFILGGAIGNFLNRFYYGYVTDFIDINFWGYNYPIFNLADTFIVIGVILLIIYTWRSDGNGNKGHGRRKYKN